MKKEPPAANSQLTHYLQVLGLKPGVGRDAIAIAYFSQMKDLQELGTSAAEERGRQVQHAFAIVKQHYRNQRRLVVRRQINRFLAVAVTILAVLLALSWRHFSLRLRPYYVSFAPGEHLYVAADHRPFGTVLARDVNHEFPDGSHQDAYRIQLDSSQTSFWISSRVAVTALRSR